MEMCVHCPFFGHPRIVGASVKTGHVRFCDLMNPGHADYNPGVDESYREITARLNDLPPEACGVLSTRYDPRAMPRPDPGPPPGVEIPKPDQMPKPKPRPPRPMPIRGGSPEAFTTHADDEAHAAICGAMDGCEHKRPGAGCCGPVTLCGPAGAHPGRRVGVAICYPCAADRLGLDVGE